MTTLATPVHIRPTLASDLLQVHELHVRAFDGRNSEASLVTALHAANKALPSLVAIDEERIVGHIVFSAMAIDRPRKGLRVAGLGPVGVLPEYQRRGIGSQLILAGIDACRGAGVDAIAVLGGPRFYSRFGFRPGRHQGLANEYVQDDHFMVLELRVGSLHEVTGLLRYAPEFKAAGC